MDERDDGDEPRPSDVAIIGMAGRFPGAPDVERFWENLRGGVESIARIAPEELEDPRFGPAMRGRPGFVPAGGILGDGDRFDNAFFGVTPAEARRMDPQLRVFLECAWAGMEDAGYDPLAHPGKIALYAGAGMSAHLLSMLGSASESPAALFDAAGSASAEGMAMRVAHELNLRGESVSVYTACSTSLVAVHMACQSLLLRQSDMAMAGGVSLSLPERTGYLYQEGMILSPDGCCRAFDERARGTVDGYGAGVVVLKLLAHALRDGDHVYAVIRGSAINNDGADKVGYAAPSVAGQADVIREALAYADVEPDTIGYVEAHGTGTPLGDPIEIAALTRAYRERTDRRGYCALGSVKTNIGHLDTAAGVAGLIKAALTLARGEIPPSLHFERPNPNIDFAGSPFFVNARLSPFPRSGAPRRAAVSSFGIGGTNAHAVLEEAPPAASGPARPGAMLFPLSARTEEALDAMTAALAAHLERRPGQELADVAYTLGVGRRAFACRRAIVARDREELCRRLREGSSAPARAARASDEPPRVAFLFPGQGSQAAGVGEALYRAEPLFRRHIRDASDVLRPLLGLSLEEILAPPEARREDAARALARPDVALPALLSVEHALVALWGSWGVRADASLGHSFGEYTAACMAGVLRFEDALRLAYERGRLVAGLAPGRMLSVALAPDELAPLLQGDLWLAATNARERSVVAGTPSAVEALAEALARRKVATAWLPVSHAFHSPLVEPMLGDLAAAFGRVTLRPPSGRYVSSRTGTWIRSEEATDPASWAAQTREPVRFAAGLDALVADGFRIFVEVGPDQALCSAARSHLGAQIRALPSSPSSPSPSSPSPSSGAKAGDARAVILGSLGALWAEGVKADLRALYGDEARRRVPLPSYPFAGPRFPATPPPRKAIVEPPDPRALRATDEAPAPRASPGTTANNAATEEAASGTAARIAGLWRELLGIEHVGVDANFLELGGNSLLAVQALTRLREIFPVDVALGDLFDALTVADLAARIDERLRLAGAAAPAPGAWGVHHAPPAVPPKLEARTPGAPPPLSYVQERVLAVDALEPGTPALNMHVILRFAEPVDARRLEEAVGLIVARHASLRAVYRRAPEGGFTQDIRERMPVPLTIRDLTEPHAEQRRAAAAAIEVEEASRPYDLERGPVLRAVLLRLGPDEHRLLLGLHHVVCDTTTLLLLVRELTDAYRALARGEPPALPALPIQYADFAAWQRRAIDEGAFAAQVAYWRERLRAMPALTLAGSRAPSGPEGLRAAVHRFTWPASLERAVEAFSQRQGATPFVTLLAAYALALGRRADQAEVVVGTPLGNRGRPELEPLLGYVAQSVALRVPLSGSPTFAALLRRARGVVLEAQDNSDVPFEMLAPELGRTREPTNARLFDAAFVLHARAVEAVLPADLGVDLAEAAVSTQFGATLGNTSLLLRESDAGYVGELSYNTDLLDAAAAARLMDDLAALLAEVIASPDASIGPLPRSAEEGRVEARVATGAHAVPPPARRPLELSLFYFAAHDSAAGAQKYRLLLDGARRADKLGFSAIWTPERHFHPFGGMYPNPAVTSAALATITERVHLRGGSVVIPLHHPARVAEEWSVIDNLSGGRVGVAFASGWHVRDFVLAPGQHARRKELLKEGLDRVRRLWRGEEIRLRDGAGDEASVRIYPRPVQPELPVWITSGGTLETFRLAGELGANLLTNIMGQRFDELTAKIAAYREAWEEHGHGPPRGNVTLMMHAFLGSNLEAVQRTVREPLLAYLRSSVDVMQGFAATTGLDVGALSPRDIDKLIERGLDRYLHAGGLFGTPESCAGLIEQVRRMDVDEVACLIDFGVPAEAALDSLDGLAALMREANRGAAPCRARGPSSFGDTTCAAGAAGGDRGATRVARPAP